MVITGGFLWHAYLHISSLELQVVSKMGSIPMGRILESRRSSTLLSMTMGALYKLKLLVMGESAETALERKLVRKIDSFILV